MFKGEILSVVLVVCYTLHVSLLAFLHHRKREDPADDGAFKTVIDDVAELKSKVSALTLQRGISR